MQHNRNCPDQTSWLSCWHGKENIRHRKRSGREPIQPL